MVKIFELICCVIKIGVLFFLAIIMIAGGVSNHIYALLMIGFALLIYSIFLICKTRKSFSFHKTNYANCPRMHKHKSDISSANLVLQRLHQSINTADTTVKPEIFFKNLHYSFDCMLELMTYKNNVFNKNCTPEEQYEQQLNYLETRVNKFIERSYNYEITKIRQLKTDSAKRKRAERYFDTMQVAFSNSDQYWSGNSIAPHYLGKLYTENNLIKLNETEKMCLLYHIFE